MNVVRKMLFAVLMGVLAVTFTATGAAQADTVRADTAVAWDAVTGEALAAWDCDEGDICFWDGFDGTGSRCNWSGNDYNWQDGNIICSWADNRPVKSVYNRGQSSTYTGVAYYHNSGYNDRAGCTKRGHKGDLAGTYEVWSHRWITTSCG